MRNIKKKAFVCTEHRTVYLKAYYFPEKVLKFQKMIKNSRKTFLMFQKL